MDSKITTTPPTPDPLAAMFQNATIDKAEKNEFSNSARSMFKFAMNNNFTKEGEDMVLESSDVIDFFRNVAQPFLAEVLKNNQYRSPVGDMTSADGNDPVSQAITTDHTLEGNPVDIIDLVPSEPSSSRVASVADRYTRSMLKCLTGYPLSEPQPFSELSTEYLRHGINVGDVGFVREDGVFDFLFNICPSKNGLINPPNLSNGFSLETSDHSATRTHLGKTCLLQTPITRTKSGEYICEGSEGAILELPEGAIQDEATNIVPFEKLAARNGMQWYEYTMTRGKEISNGSLYLVTSSTRCTQWGIAVFDRKCAKGQGLKFDKKRSLPFGKSTSKYRWKGSDTFPTKISNLNKGDAPNQCVFLKGYKIMIRQDIFDNLRNDQPYGSMPSSSSQAGSNSLTRQPGDGGGSDLISKTDGGLLSWTKMSSMTKSDEVDLHVNFNSSLVHPSDLINCALLSQNPGAKIALTHDEVWCGLLRDNFPKLDYMRLIDIARSYMSTIDDYGCVSLEKMSDPNNVLDESSPLQGTEIPALQAPLTTPDDDNTLLLTSISVTLPRELVERILLLLDTKSILACKLVNREYKEIIQSSILLQYSLACTAAGVVDNPKSPLSFVERLEALKKWEDAWTKLKPAFETTISFNCQTASQLSRLTEGVCFLIDDNPKDLKHCHLTSFPQDNPRWIRMPGQGPALDRSGLLVYFSAALYEHDLIVHFISSDIGNGVDMQWYSLDLVLLKFSTGEYHPLARCPRIHVQRSHEVEPWVVSRIVGDNLALVVHSDSDDVTFSDKLFIFDWKTGRKLLQHEAAQGAYFTLVFVSPELLLVPNHALYHFEVWHLPTHQLHTKLPNQILSLQIPAVSPKYSLYEFYCYGEPNPFLHAMPYPPPRPFFSSSETSIILVTLRISSDSGILASYNLVMHRHALLDTIQTWTSASVLEQHEYLPMWLTNEVTMHQTADLEDGSVELDAHSKLVSMIPYPRTSPRPQRYFLSSFPTSHISADSGSSSVPSGLSANSSTSRSIFLRVPWAKWGPPISRWFQVNDTHARWIDHSNGQRCAFSQPNPLDRKKLMVSVVDFNQHNCKRNAEMMAQPRKHNRRNGNNEEFEILDHKGVFSEEVYMGLKCVVYRAPDEYDFDVVSMDEQRLFGVKLNPNGWTESIKVLYIG